MLNLIQSNTSNFRNFVELQLTSHILKKQVFNTVPGDVIKVSNLFGEVNQFEKHNIFGLGVFHQFSSFVTPDLVFNEVRGGKFALLPPRCPRIGWGGGDLEEFWNFWVLENLYNGTQYQFSLLALFWKHFAKFIKLFQLNISGLRKTNSFSYFRKLLDSLKGI